MTKRRMGRFRSWAKRQGDLYDGRTGEPFDQEVVVGFIYIAQAGPLGGRQDSCPCGWAVFPRHPAAAGGKGRSTAGQRFGEMEVWAMEAYGAAYTFRSFSPSSRTTSKGVLGFTKAS